MFLGACWVERLVETFSGIVDGLLRGVVAGSVGGDFW